VCFRDFSRLVFFGVGVCCFLVIALCVLPKTLILF